MDESDATAAVRSAAFGPDSAFALLSHTATLQPLLQGVEQLIIDEASFNAFAQQTAEADTIGIYSGTLAKVTEKVSELEDFLSSFRGGSSLRAELWWDELDESEVKSRFTRLCIDFIVFHELSHVALNHCVAPRQPMRLYEAPSSINTDSLKLGVEARHAFELFADKVSTSILSGALRRLASLHQRFRFRHPSASWMGLTWAIQLVWALLAESSKDYLTEQAAFLTAIKEGRATSVPWFTHPHPSLRRAVARNSLYGLGRGWAAIFSGFLRRDSEVAIDSFLFRNSSVPMDPVEAARLSALAASSKVITGYKRRCDLAWGDYRDQLLPSSRFQSAMFVGDVLKRHGWDRYFILVYKNEKKGVIEEVASSDAPTFIERNDGRLLTGHDAHEL